MLIGGRFRPERPHCYVALQVAISLDRIVAGFDGEPERIDASRLEPRSLTDILGGVSLFSANRLVILRRVSENAPVWEALAVQSAGDSDGAR